MIKWAFISKALHLENKALLEKRSANTALHITNVNSLKS